MCGEAESVNISQGKRGKMRREIRRQRRQAFVINDLISCRGRRARPGTPALRRRHRR